MVYGSILAAGSVKKNDNSRIPRPFTLLGKKPILIHTLEQFIVAQAIERIIVVVTDEWVVYTEELIRKWIKVPKEIYVISGGINKNRSIYYAAKFIEEKWSVNEDDIILNHDAIRPFITQRIIKDNITACKRYNVVNTVMPTIDTIAVSDNKKILNSIPPKSKMYSEQTPQTFNLKLLTNAYHNISEEKLENENDTARFMMNCGYDVYFILGEYSNIKIVSAFDLEVANAFLRRLANDK